MFFIPIQQSKKRYSICKVCEKFDSSIKLCKECKCFIPAKVTLAHAICPLLKWKSSDPDYSVGPYSLSDEQTS